MQCELESAAEARAVDRCNRWERQRANAPKSSCPARVPASASAAECTFVNSSMSAPTQKTNGLPVTTIAAQSPDSSCSISAAPDSKAERPSVVGLL